MASYLMTSAGERVTETAAAGERLRGQRRAAGGLPEKKERHTAGGLPEKKAGIFDTAAPREKGVKPIGAEEISRAVELLRRYKAAKADIERRIRANEQWYRLRHGELIRPANASPGDPEPTSAWLLNCLMNKHADAMDNYPRPVILPREEGDRAAAEALGEILPVIREQNGYEQTYSDVWWYKLKSGTGVTGVFWDTAKCRGMGDIDIRKVDLMDLYWEPGITDIQKSAHLFRLELCDDALICERWPERRRAAAPVTFDTARYAYDDGADTAGKSVMVDWYYKRRQNGRNVLHYVKFVLGDDEPLFATENEPAYRERGFYDHGLYPFVFDTLFPVEGSPCGFGYVDVCKSPQTYIDRLDGVMLKYAVMAGRPRFFIRGDGQINEREYADWSKDFIHYNGSGDPRDDVMQLKLDPLPEVYLSMRQMKINELKETAGNRDFQQGGTSGSVSAASAITALQEAGNKLSRDMIKSAYRADARVTELCIGLIRQFYDEPRVFRILGDDGAMRFTRFSGRSIGLMPLNGGLGVDMGYREPVFDISVRAEKTAPYAADALNERAKELFRLGFFRPDMAEQALDALAMMDFDGIAAVRARVGENARRYSEKQAALQLSGGGTDPAKDGPAASRQNAFLR